MNYFHSCLLPSQKLFITFPRQTYCNQAISLASPQLIELGRPSLQVPSIVEYAHFVCVRAIERASGTRSERAVWTVGHWVCEVWGIDQSNGMMMGGGADDGIREFIAH